MHTYTVKEFDLPRTEDGVPALTGLSPKQLEVHLGLYKGYVVHVNTLQDEITRLEADSQTNAYAIAEVRRRFGFEFNGMRLHERYFEQFETGASPLETTTALAEKINETYGDFETCIAQFKKTGMSRGIGWTILYRDTDTDTMHIAWVSDHELGILADVDVILAMDMWEHAFMVDYTPAEKGAYIDAFLANINWAVVAERYKQ